MNIIKLITASLFIATSTIGFGQSDKEIKKASSLTCDCLNTKDLKKASTEKIQMELGLCMIEALSELDLDIALTDEGKMEEIGGKIGLEMVSSCPAFVEMMGAMMADDPEGMAELMEDNDQLYVKEAGVTKSVSGKLTEINKEQFVTINIENETGKITTLYWFEYFPGANTLEENKIGSSINVSFEEREYYMPKFEQYLTIKVITKAIVD